MIRASEAYRERIAELLDEKSTDIVRRYEERLRHGGSPLMRDSEARRKCLDQAREILADWQSDLSEGTPARSSALASRLGGGRATRGIDSAESIRAVAILFEVVVEEFRHDVPTELHDQLIDAILGLHRNVTARIAAITEAANAFLLDEVHLDQAAYRQKLAREIHDQLGNGLSVAMRQLEMYELCLERDPADAANRMAAVHQSFTELFGMIRWIMTDLRSCKNRTRLETSLVEFVQSVKPTEIQVSISVDGDDSGLPEQLRCEIVSVVREAMRNALHHAEATTMTVHVYVTPHGVHATIADNGRGFDIGTASTDVGHGLRSMRERVELIGGTFQINVTRKTGTRIELRVPLSSVPHREATAHGDDRAGDVGGAVTGKEPHQIGYLVGRTNTA